VLAEKGILFPFKPLTSTTGACWIWMQEVKAETRNAVIVLGIENFIAKDKYRTAGWL
jgi:hypothetical protein